MKFLIPIAVFILSNTALAAPQKIISLAPHITELVFALGAGEKLLATSDFSNYPPAASSLPSVANHNGVDFEQILRLQPDLIIAWQGGNKPQDLARLSALGFNLFYSSPQTPLNIADEIDALGKILGQQKEATKITTEYRLALKEIKMRYNTENKISVFYYMWPTPLMTIGKQAWANQLLDICGASNIFDDSLTSYPQVSVEEVIRRQPQKIVAAMQAEQHDIETFWQPWKALLNAPISVVDPDELHRFTPRLINGLNKLCEKIQQ